MPTAHHRNAIIGGVVGGACGFLMLVVLGLWLLRRRPDPYVDISPFTSTTSTSTQKNGGQAAYSSLSSLENATSRTRELAEKRAAIANPQATSQAPQALAVTLPQNGASVSAEASPAADAARPGTSGGGPSTTSQSNAQPALVDRIIELIAERIDRRPGQAAEGSEAPPRYAESAV